MSLWALLDGGHSEPSRRTLGQRICLWVGRRLALRHKNVHAHPTCLISPEARVHPRSGAIEIGAESKIDLGALVQGNVRIGDHSSIHAYCSLVGYGKPDEPQGVICIGNGVRVASHTVMIAANHKFDRLDAPIHAQGLVFAPITIEDDVWIGAHSLITAGVTIGRGCVIGGGSVVTHDIPPYSVAVGVPARPIKSRRADTAVGLGSSEVTV